MFGKTPLGFAYLQVCMEKSNDFNLQIAPMIFVPSLLEPINDQPGINKPPLP